ncbi:hypothetical protein B0H11DRAFT_1988039 [Mycena galericulata]|nr:hypothetical protein B0H11DRAFT_1988039 [Mycena galericulata]
MISFIGPLSLLLLIHGANSFPAPRQNTGGISIQDSMASMYNMYLQSQNVQGVSFYSLFGGEAEIAFAGVGAQGASQFVMNELLFETADRLPHMDNYNSTGQLMFSVHYQHFIQALQNDTSSTQTPAQSKELTDLVANETAACVTNLGSVTDQAYAGYQKLGGKAQESDAVFIQFATENYGQYHSAQLACSAAKDAYNKALANINGDDNGIIQAAINAMLPIINAEETLYPGLNMPVSGVGNGTVGDQYTGSMVPFYAMPSMNSTLAVWQQGTDDGSPALTWNSSHDSSVSVSASQSSSVSANWLWDSASASQNSNMSFVLTQAQSSVISVGGIELIDVVRGAWFDAFRSASATGNPATDDPLAKAHKAAFAEYFGTSANPGPAAIYNDKALVVYKPTATFAFGSQADYNAAKSAQAKASVSGGLWGVSGGASSSQSGAVFDDNALTISFNPNTENAYIVGFIMHSYWDDVTNSTAH